MKTANDQSVWLLVCGFSFISRLLPVDDSERNAVPDTVVQNADGTLPFVIFVVDIVPALFHASRPRRSAETALVEALRPSILQSSHAALPELSVMVAIVCRGLDAVRSLNTVRVQAFAWVLTEPDIVVASNMGVVILSFWLGTTANRSLTRMVASTERFLVRYQMTA